MSIIPGENFGPYRIVEQVGRGGMATVYKAYQPALARNVAIKVLPAFFAEDEGFRERFQQEAIAIAKLRHPNILSVFDYGEEGGVTYIVTEFVDGGTLAEQVGTPLPVEYTRQMLAPIAAALDYAHARGVLHRDVKPSNILLARDGTPVLSDFGLAKMMGSLPRLTATGTAVGTPEYMAPEHGTGETLGPPTDLYALAVVAYEMLTGRVPFSADTPLAVLLAHMQKPLPLPREVNPALSPAIEQVLLKGMAKAPGDRYPTASAFVSAIAEASVGEPFRPAAPAPATSPPANTPSRVAVPSPAGEAAAPAAAPPGATPLPTEGQPTAAPPPPAPPASVPSPIAQGSALASLTRRPAVMGAVAAVVLLLAGAAYVLTQMDVSELLYGESTPSGPRIEWCPARISFGETIECGIDEAGKAHSYIFDVQRGDRVRVRAVEQGGNLVAAVQVLNAAGAGVCGPSTSGQLDCRLEADGLHVLKVQDGTPERTRTGGYLVYLQRLNAPAGCAPLGFSGPPMAASIYFGAQADCFGFQGAPGDHMKITFARTSGDLVPSAVVLGPVGTEVCGPSIAGELDCRLDVDGIHIILVGDGPTPRPRTGSYVITLWCVSGRCAGESVPAKPGT